MMDANDTDDVETTINNLTEGDRAHLELECVRVGDHGKSEPLFVRTGERFFSDSGTVAELTDGGRPIIEFDTKGFREEDGDTTQKAQLNGDSVLPIYPPSGETGFSKAPVMSAAVTQIEILNEAENGGDE